MNNQSIAREVYESLSWGEAADTSDIISQHNKAGLSLDQLDDLTSPALTGYLSDSVLDRNPSLSTQECMEIARQVARELCSGSEWVES